MDGDLEPGRWAVGLDIGGTKVLGVLVDLYARVPEVRHTVRLPTVRGCEGVVASASAVVEALAAAAGIPVTRLRAVGVGVPGVVDPESGEVSHAVNLGITGTVRLGALLSARLQDAPVRVDNDLNVAALGAARVRAARLALVGVARGGGRGLGGGADDPVTNRARSDADLAYLSLGTGVAAGLLLDGSVRRGARGAAGEIGHVPVVPDGLACPCGQRGCLERYASGAALDVAWPSHSGRPSPVELFAAAADGDPAAVAVRDGFAAAVAAAVRLLILTCDVDRVVIGGGVSGVGAPLLRAVREALAEQAARSPFLRSMAMADRVELAPQDVPVAAIGAALLCAAVSRGTPAEDVGTGA
ncbi:glucokinase [mine drainage metagenome]|uniref:Glucokinase n=1 Tax=mine drainage metagenome TaxID=410659 RepID=A0A1J5QBV5_9ZZZZ